MIDQEPLQPKSASRSLTFSPSPTDLYYGILQPGSAQAVVSPPVRGWDNFLALFHAQTQNGMVLVSADEYLDGDDSVFVATFTPWSGQGNFLLRGFDWQALMNEIAHRFPKIPIVDISVRPAVGGNAFMVVGLGTQSTKQTIVTAPSYSAFYPQWQQLSENGNRLTAVAEYNTDGDTAFIGVFQPGTAGYGLWLTPDLSTFQGYYEKAQSDGQGLVDMIIMDALNGVRWYIGVSLAGAGGTLIGPSNWATFSAAVAGSHGVVSAGVVPGLPQPDWQSVFANALGNAEGYAYAVAQFGTTVASGAVGYTRSQNDPPQTSWTTNSLVNIASVSKPVTAVATLQWLKLNGISLDTPFYSYLSSHVKAFGDGVEEVTFRNLLQMRSGLVENKTLYTDDFWLFVQNYLAQARQKPIGTYEYSNTNFTILQAVLEAQTGSYTTWVTSNVFSQLGLGSSQFTPTALPSDEATLIYTGNTDPNPGTYWSTMQCVGPGGWIATANGLLGLLVGLRNNVLLTAAETQMMFEQSLGWYTINGLYGSYFHHNGGLNSTTGTKLRTGIVHFSNGYDAVLLVNSPVDDIIGLMVNAFQATAALPAGITAAGPRIEIAKRIEQAPADAPLHSDIAQQLRDAPPDRPNQRQ